MYLPRKFRADRIEAPHAAMLEIGAAAIVGVEIRLTHIEGK